MEVKVQCGCGLKYAFEVEPVNGRMPATIYCPKCGADGTDIANAIISQNIVPPASSPASVAPAKGKLRVSGGAHSAPASTAATPSSTPASESSFGFCHRHIRTEAAAFCTVCQKPICQACMAQFGYLCSVACRYQAQEQRIPVPVYEGQRSVVESNWWKKAGLISAVVLLLAAGLMGTWFWYIWSGSRPRVAYTLNFSKTDVPRHTRFLSENQVLFVRSKQLALHDLQKKADVWTADFASATPEDFFSSFDKPKLHVTKDTVWICQGTNLLSFDRKTGAGKQSITLPGNAVELAPNENWISIISVLGSGRRAITRVDLSNNDVKSEQFKVTPVEHQWIADELPEGASPTAAFLLNNEVAKEDDRKKAMRKVFSEFIPTGINAVEMQVRLVQPNVVAVQAMKKAGPSVVNANTSVATGAGVVAEEIFNEMKRNRTGGMKMVDESKYQVTIRRLLGSAGDPWTTEVTGPPAFFPQKSVDLLVAGRALYIFDKQNTKLGEAKLTYTIGENYQSASGSTGPALELNNTLYFYDQGELIAFDLPTCRVRWRITTVGVSQIESDGQGNLYVTSTTASPEDIQYSEQIKVGDRTESILLKIEAKTGEILWKSRGAAACHVTGKFIYATSEPTGGLGLLIGVGEAFGSFGGSTPTFRIYRISPSNGKRLWEHEQREAPRQIDFSGNRILLLQESQLQVLKYIAF